MTLTTNLFLCLMCAFSAKAANVLVVFPVPSRSHQILGDELVKGLLKKGHHVTMASPYGMKLESANYTDIAVEELLEYKKMQQTNVLPVVFFKEKFEKMMSFNHSKIETMMTILKEATMSKIFLESPGIKNLLNSRKVFDVVVVEIMMCEALLVLGHIYNAPTVVVTSFGSEHTSNEITGNSCPFAYVPNNFGAFTDEMTFLQRVKNTALTLTMNSLFDHIFIHRQTKVLEENFPDAPSLDDLKQNVSIVLLNAHFSVVETPRSYMPNMIPIGGFHIQPETLPKDLKLFLDEAKEGVVLFSLGSNVKSADLPQDKLNAILKTFSKFSQKFLWKFEEDGLKVPENVNIFKWLPQRAVLNHPNVKAFITHGGMLSITEAVYYGVPFIGIPAFGDQQYNVANAVHKKFAIGYDINTLSEESFTEVVKEILQNAIYKETISKRSSLLREQPIPPLDLAIYWIEHVIKYKGAPHLQSAGIRLKWYQQYLLDVIVFLLGIMSIVIYVNVLIVRKCLRFTFNRFLRMRKVKSS